MVKGIINAFDHMELCFVINLTKDGNWTITRPPIFANKYVSFDTNFIYKVASTAGKKVNIYLSIYLSIVVKNAVKCKTHRSKICFCAISVSPQKLVESIHR